MMPNNNDPGDWIVPQETPALAQTPQSADDWFVPPEPEDTGLFSWLKDSIIGKHDPKYKGVKTIYEQHPELAQSGALGTDPTASAAILGASDPQMADIIASHLGDKVVRRDKDENGYDVIVTKGADGKEQAGYVNAPGLDSQDMWRTFYGAAPYVVTGLGGAALARKMGSGALVSAGLQALGAGATSVLGDVAQAPLGSDQGIEPVKALTMTGAGALGELGATAGSALWRRFITEPKYFNRATGTLTDLGRDAARKMGLDPADMMADVQKAFAKTYAKSPEQAAGAVAAATHNEFDIPSTVGQRTKNPGQLLQEKAMRIGVHGDPAASVINKMDAQQKEAVARAIQQTVPSTLKGEAVGALPSLGDAGERIGSGLSAVRGAAKAEERAAWPKEDITPTMDALPLLGDAMRDNLGDYAKVLDPTNTPAAWKMGTMIHDYMKGEAPSNELANAFGLTTNNGVDAMRKSIGLVMKDAQTPTDRAAAGAIYHAFDDWVERAAQQGALSGDINAVLQFRTARNISKEMNNILAPRVGNKLTPGGKLIDAIKLAGDTPERIVSTLFTGPKADIKAGAIEALTKIKQGLTRYLDPEAAATTWNDIRLAHWSKTMLGGNGEVLGAQALRENLKHALNKQGSMMHTLYAGPEIAQMRRLLGELEKITYVDPNPSGSATGVAALARQFGKTLLDAIPGAKFVWEYSQIPSTYGKVVAKRAVDQSAGSIPIAQGTGFALPAATNQLGADQ